MEIEDKFKTVIDPATKLEWKCAVEGKFTFDQALEKFGQADAAGFSMPTLDELKTLIGANKYITDAMELNDNFVWSSSHDVDDAQRAWGVYFGTGCVYDGYRNGTLYVRLVRAG